MRWWLQRVVDSGQSTIYAQNRFQKAVTTVSENFLVIVESLQKVYKSVYCTHCKKCDILTKYLAAVSVSFSSVC